jgi:hypothetical protein
VAGPAPLRALVLGGANTLAVDRAAALELFAPDLVIACNHAARDEPGRVDHWATMHSELLPKWIAARRAAGRPAAGQYWHARHRPCVVEGARPIESWGGSSGLLCVAVAYQLGCTHVVLAGVPMIKNMRHYDDTRPWLEARQYWPAWERRRHVMQPKVRSLSGWTQELLGGPTAEWLNAVTA